MIRSTVGSLARLRNRAVRCKGLGLGLGLGWALDDSGGEDSRTGH